MPVKKRHQIGERLSRVVIGGRVLSQPIFLSEGSVWSFTQGVSVTGLGILANLEPNRKFASHALELRTRAVAIGREADRKKMPVTGIELSAGLLNVTVPDVESAQRSFTAKTEGDEKR